MAVDPWAGPVYTTGYRSLIPSYEQHGLYHGGHVFDAQLSGTQHGGIHPGRVLTWQNASESGARHDRTLKSLRLSRFSMIGLHLRSRFPNLSNLLSAITNGF